MAHFRYKVKDSSGKLKSGLMEGPSQDMVRTIFARKRMAIISLQEVELDENGKEIGGLKFLGVQRDSCMDS